MNRPLYHPLPMQMFRIESENRRSEDNANPFESPRVGPRRRTLVRAAQVCLQCADREVLPPKDIIAVAEKGYTWFTQDKETAEEAERVLAWAIFLSDRHRWVSCVSRVLWPFFISVYFFSSLFETPTWCLAESIDAPRWDDCGDPKNILRSEISGTLGAVHMRVVHSVCLLGFIVLTALDYRIRHGWNVPQTNWLWLCVASLTGALTLSLVGIVLDMMRAASWLVRLTALLSVLFRPLVLMSLNVFRVQRTAERLWVAAKASFASIGLMVAVLLAYSWIGIVLFAFQSEGVEFMNSIEHSVLNMFITMTTANFPMVMMAVYSQYRASCWFFISFLVLNLYILQNVILADVSHGFKEKYKQHLHDDKAVRLRCAEVAFGLLAEPDAENDLCIQIEFVQALAEMHFIQTGLGSENASQIASGHVIQCALASEVLEDDFVDFFRGIRPPDPSAPLPMTPSNSMSAWERSCHRLQTVEEIVDATLFCNLIVAALKTAMIMRAKSVEESHRYLNNFIQVSCHDFETCVWPTINTTLSLLSVGFVFELIWKVRTFGIYWFSHMAPLRNPLDVILITAGLCAEILTTFVPKWSPLGPRFPMVIRMVRAFVRLSLRVHPWLVLFRSMLFLVQIFKGLFAFVTLWFLMFATIGTHVFGGRIRLDSVELKGTDYAAAAGGIGYYANNFNDIGSATVTLFELMVINDWWVLTGGFAAVLPEAPWFAWAFAIVFWAGTFLFVLNVCTGMVVESLFSIRTKGHAELSSYIIGLRSTDLSAKRAESERSPGSTHLPGMGYRTSTHDLLRLRDELLEDVLG